MRHKKDYAIQSNVVKIGNFRAKISIERYCFRVIQTIKKEAVRTASY
jgi:hypothetical protein